MFAGLVLACLPIHAQVNVVPPGSIVEGLTLEEWSVEWWEWSLSIACAINPSLDANGTYAHVGQSETVVLEIGPDSKVFSRDKAEEVDPALFGSGLALNSTLAAAGLTGSSSSWFISVALGSMDGTTTNNLSGPPTLGEPNHCDVLGGASRWFVLRPENDGTLIINTIGSEVDTVLAVYRATNSVVSLFSMLEACDDNSAPDGIRSVVRFWAYGGVDYLVVVDGVNGAQGTIILNWKLGLAPQAVFTQMQILPVTVGGDVILCTKMEGIPPPNYQWYFQGDLLVGATNETLTLTGVGPGQMGTYSVMASNFVGEAWETNLVVAGEAVMRLRDPARLANGSFEFWVEGEPGARFVVEAVEELGQCAAAMWVPVMTNESGVSPFRVLDGQAGQWNRRYYRTVSDP